MKIRRKPVVLVSAVLAVLAIAGLALTLSGPGERAAEARVDVRAGPENPDAANRARGPAVTVYKSPACGCCGAWVDHLREHGFEVTAVDTDDMRPVKRRFGIGPGLESCHTAIVDDYVVEGHVPAELVRRLLDEGPEIAGLSVPGMPIGSPGMEVPGRPAEPYDVLAFDRAGRIEVYASR